MLWKVEDSEILLGEAVGEGPKDGNSMETGKVVGYFRMKTIILSLIKY